LKVADPYDGQYLDDDEELGVCGDCLEDFAAAVPAERLVQLLAEAADPEMLSQVTESSEMEN